MIILKGLITAIIQYHPDKVNIVKYKSKKMNDLLNCIVSNILEEDWIVINYNEKWVVNEKPSELWLVLNNIIIR